MNEHALDAMIYAWLVMDEKKKEENKMEGIFLGKIDQTAFEPRSISLSFRTKHLDQHVEVRKELDYDCDYVLVKADDVITTNDELLKLREKVKKLEAELMEVKTARTLREAYITGVEKGCESLREERDRWKRRWNSVVTDISKSLAANGVEFKLKENDGEATWVFVVDIPELTEAKKKIAELETKLKITESRETYWRDRKEEEEDHHHYWLHTFNRVVKLAAEKGVYIAIAGKDNDCNAGIVVAENKKTADLESQVVQMEDANQKLRQRISAADEEIEKLKSQHTSRSSVYWRNTYYAAVEAANNEGVSITSGHGINQEANAAVIEVINYRAKNLEKKIQRLEDDNSADKNRGDHWKRNYEDLAEYWDNTCKDLVATGKKVGVKIEFKGDKSDSNTGNFDITNEKAIELMVNVSDTKHEYNKKWQAMLNALKAKGIEVVYMGEQDSKPIIDVKVPGWEADKQWIRDFSKLCVDLRADKFRLERERDELKEQCDILRKDYIVRGQIISDLKKEIEDLKSNKVATCTVETGIDGNLKFVFTYMDGHNEPAHINCLCKNHVAIDASSISCGTVPKCKSCAHYMHNAKYAHDWCHKPVSKEGPGRIRKLNKEEAEGPACSDFKARKE